VLGAKLTSPGPGEPDPFSLADPDHFESLLASAGFDNIVVTPVTSSRVITTAHANDEVRALLEVGPVGEAFEGADVATRQRAIDSVIEAIEPFRDGEGWRLASVPRGMLVVLVGTDVSGPVAASRSSNAVPEACGSAAISAVAHTSRLR